MIIFKGDEMNRMRFFGLLMLGLFVSVQAWGASPSWLAGESSQYPNAKYLVGRGQGSTESEAQNRARADLAAVFEVRIAVVTENATTVTQSNGRPAQASSQATQRVSAKTDKVISGMTIAEIWRDPVTKDFHVLAVLPRAQAAAGLRQELSQIDRESQQYLQTAQGEADPFLKLGGLTKVLQSVLKREGFQASLQVVDPTGRGVPAELSQADVQILISQTLQTVQITPRVMEDSAVSEFAGVLKGGLAAAGFLAAQGNQAQFELQGKLALVDLGRRGDWNWMRGTVEISLVEKATGRVRGSKTWPVKSSAQDVKTVRSRVLLEVEKLLNQQLRATLIGFAAR
jgi:hypothetical protein